jgi:hypothetical protein
MVKLLTALLVFFSVSFAHANCPDLSGTWLRETNGNKAYLKIRNDLASGAMLYNLKTGSNGTDWSWSWWTLANGEPQSKEISKDYVNVTEIATCSADGKLHRSQTGDWINSDDLVPYDLQVDIYLENENTLHWVADFTGFGIVHDVTDAIYVRQ